MNRKKILRILNEIRKQSYKEIFYFTKIHDQNISSTNFFEKLNHILELKKKNKKEFKYKYENKILDNNLFILMRFFFKYLNYFFNFLLIKFFIKDDNDKSNLRILFHSPISDNTNNIKLDNYFYKIYKYLDNNKNKFLIIPWIFSGRNKFKLHIRFQKMKYNFFIKEKNISIKEFILYSFIFFTKKSIRNVKNINSIKVQDILNKEEKKRLIDFDCFDFYLLAKSLGKYLNNLQNEITYIDTIERSGNELCFLKKKSLRKINLKIVQHTYFGENQINYYLKNRIVIKPKSTYIICSSKRAINFFKKQKLNKIIIKQGINLRQNIKIKKNNRKNKSQVCVLLPLDHSYAKELVDFLNKEKKLEKFLFIIKTHPLYRDEVKLNKENLLLDTKNKLEDILSKSDIAMGISTASLIDAALYNLNIINIKSDKNININPFYLFGNRNRDFLLKNKKNLNTILENFFKSKKNNNVRKIILNDFCKFSNIRNYL